MAGNMRDMSLVARNIDKMISQNAPESDIDMYVSSEGYNPATFGNEYKSIKGGFASQHENYIPPTPPMESVGKTAMSTLGRIPGKTIEFGKELGGMALGAGNAMIDVPGQQIANMAVGGRQYADQQMVNTLVDMVKKTGMLGNMATDWVAQKGTNLAVDPRAELTRQGQYMAQEPVKAALNVSMAAGAGAGLLGKGNMLGRGLNTLSEVSNPLNVIPAVKNIKPTLRQLGQEIPQSKIGQQVSKLSETIGEVPGNVRGYFSKGAELDPIAPALTTESGNIVDTLVERSVAGLPEAQKDIQLLHKALRPPTAARNFAKQAQVADPLIKEVTYIKPLSENPIGELKDLTVKKQQQLLDNFNTKLATLGENQFVSGDSIGDAVIKTIPEKIRFEAKNGSPDAQRYIDEVENAAIPYYGTKIPLSDLNQFRQETNIQLENFWKNPAASKTMGTSMGVEVAKNKAFRDALYGKLAEIAPKAGEDMRKMMAQYGALDGLEDIIRAREIVYARQAPMDLASSIAMIESAGPAIDVLTGNIKGLIGRYARMKEADIIKEANDTNALLKRIYNPKTTKVKMSEFKEPINLFGTSSNTGRGK